MKNLISKKNLIVLVAMACFSITPLFASADELIINGGFENENFGWEVPSSSSIFSDGSYPHSGSRYAAFGFANNLSEGIQQRLTVPPATSNPQFSFWYNITTDETTSSTAFDKFFVNFIEYPSGNYLGTIPLSNLNKQGGDGNPYYQKYTFDLSPFAGKNLAIQLLSTTDGSNPTRFRIDDVSLTYTSTITPPPIIDRCSDGIDNDGDGKIDAEDPGCHTDGNASNPSSYDPSRENEEDLFPNPPPPTNHPPTIILVGNDLIQIPVGTDYHDAGATAFDEEDGDLTSKIITTGAVNTAVPGIYDINYNVTDSQGQPAPDIGRTVIVITPIDLCPNIDGIQNPIPAGMELAGDGSGCVDIGTSKIHLIVEKTTIPANDPTVFTISATSGTGGIITGGGAGTVTDALDKSYEVTTGTYSVAETVPAGWTKTGDTCQNVLVLNVSGSTVHCLLTNTKIIVAPRIDSDKDCISDDEERQIGTDPNNTDTDGDGLFDGWEAKNLDMENSCQPLGFDLVGAGANPQHKDIFLEIDWMDCTLPHSDCTTGDTHNHKPSIGAIQKVQEAFSNAPIENKDGKNGITLHVDLSNAIPHEMNTSFSFPNAESDFDSIKGTNFNYKKLPFYHYALFTHGLRDENNNAIENSGMAEIGGNDFMVALGKYGSNEIFQTGTLMHELGHNLGLGHGGITESGQPDYKNYKPNYLSVMNYDFQFRGIPPLYRYDYSSVRLPALNENNLDEKTGIQQLGNDITFYRCPGLWWADDIPVPSVFEQQEIDWNCDGNINNNFVGGDVNGDDLRNQLNSSSDWGNLVYNFRTNTTDYADGVHLNTTSPKEEMSVAEAETRGLTDPIKMVIMDIKPWSNTNPINLSANGVIPIAIITSDDFNAQDILPETAMFAGAKQPENWHFEDVNNDGKIDMVFQYKINLLSAITPESKFALFQAKTNNHVIVYATDNISPK